MSHIAKGLGWGALGMAVWSFPAVWATWTNDTKATALVLAIGVGVCAIVVRWWEP